MPDERLSLNNLTKPIKAFMTAFRTAFPDLHFWGAADLIADGDYVVGRWEGGGTHAGPAFHDFLLGALPAATGRTMHFTGTTVLPLQDGKIAEEIGLDEGVTAPSHLICQKWCVDLNGRILELLNQFRARRSAYFSRPRACLKNRGHCVPRFL